MDNITPDMLLQDPWTVLTALGAECTEEAIAFLEYQGASSLEDLFFIEVQLDFTDVTEEIVLDLPVAPFAGFGHYDRRASNNCGAPTTNCGARATHREASSSCTRHSRDG
jgi:hypothetical protein